MIAYRDVPGRWRSLAVLVTTLLSAGCQGGDNPVAPDPLRCPSASVPLCTDAVRAAAVRGAAGDAQLRLVPALESSPTRALIAQRLTVIAASLEDGDVAGVRRGLAPVRAAVSDARRQIADHPADAADLAAIELTLDQITAVVGDS